MTPDNQNPGSVESAANAETLNLQANKTEAAPNVVRAESQPEPRPGASSSAGQATQAQQQQSVVKNDDNTIQDQKTQNYFESQITQLPAEELDTIEQAWVDKANEIEEKAANDPYSEDEAQHALSRAYLKKRFNIDVE